MPCCQQDYAKYYRADFCMKLIGRVEQEPRRNPLHVGPYLGGSPGTVTWTLAGGRARPAAPPLYLHVCVSAGLRNNYSAIFHGDGRREAAGGEPTVVSTAVIKYDFRI